MTLSPHQLVARPFFGAPHMLPGYHPHQVMAHPFFCGLDWAGLRAGALPPPITPSIDAVHAGSIAEVGEAHP